MAGRAKEAATEFFSCRKPQIVENQGSIKACRSRKMTSSRVEGLEERTLLLFSFSKIADSGTSIPCGTVTFTQLSDPSIDGSHAGLRQREWTGQGSTSILAD
jgi:hypothetical protein